MIKNGVATFLVFGALLGVSAQAAPTPPAFVQTQVTSGDAVEKVIRHFGTRRRFGWGHWRFGSANHYYSGTGPNKSARKH
jgi:hypothetical protein